MYRLLVIFVTALLYSAQASTSLRYAQGSAPDEGCQLPTFPKDGEYTVSNYKDRKIVPGDVVIQFTVLTYSCNEDSDLTTKLSVCQESNTWSTVPECNRRCIMPTSHTVNFECYSSAGPVPCSSALPSGSTVHSTCKNIYATVMDLLVLSCRDGSWDNPIPSCEPDCGLEVAFSRQYIVHGITVKRDLFPWHVAIFQDLGAPVPEQICGGSLVRAHLVISAAHCFYDPINNVQIDSRFYSVACGKLFRTWDSEADNKFPFVQKSEVKQIMMHNYRGDEQYHRNDVAILVLSSPFTLSDSVRPICVDLNSAKFNKLQLGIGKSGKVAGWGLMETEQSSEELKSLELPVIDFDKCFQEMIKYKFTRYLTEDKLCAGHLNGAALCQGDSGGGLVFPAVDYTNSTRWYLRGVVSNGPHDELRACRVNTYTAFTEIFKLSHWLRPTLQDVAVAVDGCVLPNFPHDGRYTVSNYKDKEIVPGDIVSHLTTLTYSCGKKSDLKAPSATCQRNNTWSARPECKSPAQVAATLAGDKHGSSVRRCAMVTSLTVDFTCRATVKSCEPRLPTGTVIRSSCKPGHSSPKKLEELKCIDGRWDRPTPECQRVPAQVASTPAGNKDGSSVRRCTMVTSLTVDFTCHATVQSCEPRVPSGTIIRSSCKPGHNSTKYLEEMKCIDGSWDRPTPKCHVECGLEDDSISYFFTSAADTVRGTFPWNVAIYRIMEGTINYICGGTLLQTNVVISAAHCFYDSLRNASESPKDYKIVVGKIYQDWDSESKNGFLELQKSGIKQILLHEGYDGEKGNQQSDVALLELTTPVNLSAIVRPVCIDLVDEEFDKRQLKEQNIGTVAGWGVRRNNIRPEIVMTLSVPVVGFNECRQEMSKYNYTRYLTKDKLCAGYTDGTIVCQGDGGGGLVFPEKDEKLPTRWFLRAIVSVGPLNDDLTTCRENTYTVYTHIFKLKDWISRQLRTLI